MLVYWRVPHNISYPKLGVSKNGSPPILFSSKNLQMDDLVKVLPWLKKPLVHDD